MKPIPFSATLSEMSLERVKIFCDINYRFCEERESLFEKAYEAINFRKHSNRLHMVFIGDATAALCLQRPNYVVLIQYN
jgi:hypothetical protein